jgi:hypothetical protein
MPASKALSHTLFLLWVILATIILLIVAELACRQLIPQWTSQHEDTSLVWQYDPELGWSQKPDTSTTIKYPQFEISVQTNSIGLRDKEYPFERTDKKRILFLGDSYTWGFGVEYEERFTEILESRHPEWEMINAGLSGYGTDQEYLYYLKEGHKFNADVVILLLYYNDFENNYRSEQFYYHKPYFTIENGNLVRHNNPVPESSLSQKIERYIETRTVLIRKIRFMFNFFISLATYHFKSEEAQRYTGGFTNFKESKPITNKLLATLKEEVEANNSKFILFGVPIRPGLAKNLDKLAIKENIQYLNLDPFFDGKEKENEIPGTDHWNTKGQLLAADVMEKFLISKGVLQQANP